MIWLKWRHPYNGALLYTKNIFHFLTFQNSKLPKRAAKLTKNMTSFPCFVQSADFLPYGYRRLSEGNEKQLTKVFFEKARTLVLEKQTCLVSSPDMSKRMSNQIDNFCVHLLFWYSVKSTRWCIQNLKVSWLRDAKHTILRIVLYGFKNGAKFYI